MELRLTISGLCAFVTDRDWKSVPGKPHTSTTREAWALLVGHRGGNQTQAQPGHGHPGHAHAPGLVVEYHHLGRTSSNPDRLFDDPEGRHWAWWDLGDTRVEVRHGAGPHVELETGRRTDRPCVDAADEWHDVMSLADAARAYPGAALVQGWQATPPGTLPIVTQIILRDGRVRALEPGAWAHENRWKFASGYERAISEVLEYRRSSAAASMTLMLTPYDGGAPRQIVLNDKPGLGAIPVAISHLTPEITPDVRKHLELYLELLTQPHGVPDYELCRATGKETTFPDACPQMLFREVV